MSEALEIMDGGAMPLGVVRDPMWDKARRLLAEGRRVAVEFAAEIERLKSAHSKGYGGDRRSSSQVVNLKSGEGFVVQLREQLGLHPEQARRLLADVDYQRRIEALTGMEPGEVIAVPGKGREARPVELAVTPRMIELAREAREAWGAPGCPKASRQWAGIAGEGMRVDVEGGGNPDRQPPDDLGLWVKAVKTIQRCGRGWDRYFDSLDKARAIAELGDALKSLPEHVLDAVIEAATGGRR